MAVTLEEVSTMLGISCSRVTLGCEADIVVVRRAVVELRKLAMRVVSDMYVSAKEIAL